MLQENTPSAVWLGASDQREEGNWTWTDCSPWNFTRWGVREDHQQPDNSNHKDGNGEDCALFHGKNTTKNIDWNDVACNIKERQFICSKVICGLGKASF